MKSTAHIQGHPIHPMLIPYPFALLSSAAAFDVSASVAGRPSLAQTASHLSTAGLVSALVAAVPGLIDYFGTVPRHTKARRSATQHALLNVSALLCFGLAETRRRDDATLPQTGLALEVVGTGLLSVAGWLGGELVYHDQMGVVDHPAPDAGRLPQASTVEGEVARTRIGRAG